MPTKISSGCGACSMRPFRLDDPHVGRVDDRAPGERDDPAGDRRADQHRARAGRPEPAVEPAQRRREQEARGGGDRDHLDVARLLAVDRGAHELREAVRAPAERVQAPEQEVAVAAQEVEIHPANLFKIRRAAQRPVSPAARLVAGRHRHSRPSFVQAGRGGKLARDALAQRRRRQDLDARRRGAGGPSRARARGCTAARARSCHPPRCGRPAASARPRPRPSARCPA